MLSEMVVLENRTNVVITMKEWRHLSPNDCYSYTIQLLPSERKEIRATKFFRRSIESSRPAVLEIFEGEESRKCLTPQVFKNHAKIIFEMVADAAAASSSSTSDHPRQVMMVRGVKAKVSDICRLRGLGFLGREYHGTPEETII